MAFKIRRKRKPITHRTKVCAFGWDDGSIVHVWEVRGKTIVYARDYMNRVIDIIDPVFLKECTEDLFKISLPSSTQFIVRTVKAQTEVLSIGTIREYANHKEAFMKKEKVIA